jgi:hypothetical protein
LEWNQSLPLPSGFETTAWLADLDGRGEIRAIFLGSRQGALAFYKPVYRQSKCEGFKLYGIWRGIHDHEAVRSIRLHKPWENLATTEIMTTGRNGAYQVLKIGASEQVKDCLPGDVVDGCLPGVTMQILQRMYLNRGWLEGVIILWILD